jgi:(p)ppGpp synthase/HD superfamily hydrolase
MDQIIKARDFAIAAHNKAGHTYHGKPYVSHLSMVAFSAGQFADKIFNGHHKTVIVSAAWTHEVLKLPTVSFNDLRLATNLLSAWISFALLPNKGKTRNERYDDHFFESLKEVPYADFLKICDRLANATYAAVHNDAMLRVYKAEHFKFKEYLYKDEYKPIFDLLDRTYEKI